MRSLSGIVSNVYVLRNWNMFFIRDQEEETESLDYLENRYEMH